jgi:Ca2+-binding EF-hand superfamily protein
MRWILALVTCSLVLLVVSTPVLPQQAKEAKPADGFDIVFLGDTRPILMRMHVEMNGKPIKTVWREYLKQWFDYLDRDISGGLDAKEVQFAPNDQAMQLMMRQGNFFQQRNQPMKVTDFVKDKENVTFDDFAAYYERRSIGNIQLSGANGGQAYDPTGDTLFKLLDKNDDGKLSKQEIADAAKVLMKLDTDDDEFVSAAEIVPDNAQSGLTLILRQPGLPPAGPVSKSFYRVAGAEDNGLALLLLATYDRNKDKKLSRAESGLPKEMFDRIDSNKDGELDVEELTRWHQRPADFTYTVRLGKTEAAHLELIPVKDKKLAKAASKAGDAQLLTLGDAQIQIARDGNNQRPGQIQLIRNNILQVFQQADIKKQGFLEVKDLQQNRVFQQLIPLFPLLDKDGDGKLTEKELREYVVLQAGAADCLTNLSIAEHGRNLFKLLDANGDRRLSLRELKSAWERLKHLDVDGDGNIDLTELTRQFQLTFDQGVQNQRGFVVALRGPMAGPAPRPKYPANTPLWFKKMDRNGDGDVSFREFLGTREEFNAIDTDGDGLISAAEAERFDDKLRKNKK